MDASLIATLLAATGAAAFMLQRKDQDGQLDFIARNWGDIARAMRERGTPDAMVERFRTELFAAL
jgi:hypothetical protein